MNRAREFNNAGARLLEVGNNRVALELFKAALEAKLACEHNAIGEAHCREGSSSKGTVADSSHRVLDSESIRLAEEHLSRFDDHLNHVHSNNAETSSQIELGLPEPIVPHESQGFNAYLFLDPFEYPQNNWSKSNLGDAIIICNLGIAYHKASRYSRKAADFYKLCAMILAREPLCAVSGKVRVALLNNFAVWCYENGDGGALRTCIEHLSVVLARSITCLDSGLVQNIQTNVSLLLTPPNGGSPAA